MSSPSIATAGDKAAVQTPAPVEDGKLAEDYGRAFHTLCELGRFYANEMGEVVPGLGLPELRGLRGSAQGMRDLLLINSRMYSYWDLAPSGPGVCELLAKQYCASRKDLVKGCAAHGCERVPSDGGGPIKACRACMVPYYCSKECQQADWPQHKKNCKIWRQGNKASIREENLPMEYQVMRAALGKDVQFWGQEKHRITGSFYVVKHTPEGMLLLKEGDTKPTVYVVQGIAESMNDVLQRSRRPLPVQANLTLLPFMGRLVYDGLMAGSPIDIATPLPELEARVEEAQAAGAVVDCMMLPDEPPVRPAPATAPAGGPGPSEPSPGPTLSTAAKRALKQISGARKDTNEQTFFWVCRRFGYSKAENPHNMAALMAGPVPVRVEPMRAKRLEYTGEEVLVYLAKGVKAMRTAPKFIGIDCLPALNEVKEALAGVGIEAGYYPPPSAEERALFGS